MVRFSLPPQFRTGLLSLTNIRIVVDGAMQIVDRYQEQIVDLEQKVLIEPKMTSLLGCEWKFPFGYFVLEPSCLSAYPQRGSHAV